MQSSLNTLSAPMELPGIPWFSRWMEALSDPGARLRLYCILAAFLYVISIGSMAVKARYSHRDARFDFACSDGKYYYVYVPALLLEHNLDIAPIMKKQWGYTTYKASDLDMHGHVRDKYPIGVAVSVLPSFLVAHVISYALYAVTGIHYFEPDGYTVIYQLLNLAWVMAISVATIALIDWLMVNHFGVDGPSAAISVLATYLGTQYAYHLLRYPLMYNVFAPFWATCCVVLPVIAIKRLKQSGAVGWHWPAMVFCFCMVVISRNTNVLFGVFLAYALYELFKERRLGALVPLLPLIALGFLPVVLQLMVWHYQMGQFIANSYGTAEPFYWTHPAFWQEMFSRLRWRAALVPDLDAGNGPGDLLCVSARPATLGSGLLVDHLHHALVREQCLVVLAIYQLPGQGICRIAGDARDRARDSAAPYAARRFQASASARIDRRWNAYHLGPLRRV